MNYKIPDMLYIETTNTCNANCIFCAYQYDKRDKNIISMNLLEKIAKEYKEAGGNKISLSPFAGEIFTDPNILKKINYLNSFDFEVIYSYTNALLFHKFNIDEILQSGLTSLNISLAPLEKETYIKIYRNKNYNQLLDNLSNFLSRFHTIKNKTLKSISIEFRTNIPLKKIEELNDYKKFVAPFINKNITVSAMTTFDSWMGMIKQNNLLDGMQIKNPDFEKKVPCMRLNMLQVLANGDTRICGCRYNNNSTSKEDVFNVGNAYNENILSMYNKQKVADIKNSFYLNKIPEECKLCSWYEGIKNG